MDRHSGFVANLAWSGPEVPACTSFAVTYVLPDRARSHLFEVLELGTYSVTLPKFPALALGDKARTAAGSEFHNRRIGIWSNDMLPI